MRRNGSSLSVDTPFALVENVKGAIRLAAIDPAARKQGLVPGLTLADARARVPELAVHDHDPAADARWLDRLSEGCGRYTPMATALPPDALLLDITGCTHLFGGELTLVADAVKRLKKLGMATRFAFAPTSEAAYALARWGKGGADDEEEAVRRLPVAALALDAEKELGLRRAGLKTIGMVAERLRPGIAARFGEETVTALERLLGHSRMPLGAFPKKAAIHAERRFPEPVARTEYALEILSQLLREAGEELYRRGKGGRCFEARFFRADGLAKKLSVELGRPTRDPEEAMRLFRERIDTLDDPIDPGFGFDAIRLSVAIQEDLPPSQIGIEGDTDRESRIAAMIDRLSVRLGRNGVVRCHPVDTHIPEACQRLVPAIEKPKEASWPRPAPGEPPRRPLQLFDPPEPIRVTAEVPDGPPWRFIWRGRDHRVTLFEGPERIASEWWRSPRDPLGETRLTRDYYRVEDSEGRRYWLFRHGLYAREKRNMRWYMHGLFA